MGKGVIGGPATPVYMRGSSTTEYDPLPVALGGASADSFGRLRTGHPHTLFDSQLQYSLMPLYWSTETANGGTATHLPNESSARLRVTGTSGSKVVRQTKRYYRYQPGKSQKVTTTFRFDDNGTNVRRRVGYFDTRNGIFLEQLDGNLSLVRRTYVTGSAVDNKIARADWNIDKMDGTGPSGVTLDFAKTQIFLIDLEWLGVGSVRCGFVVNGKLYYCHQINNANTLTTVYMTTANLPVRYEIENTGAGSGNADLIQICAEVSSEGGLQERSQVFALSSGAVLRSVTNAYLPVLSIRVGTVFPAAGSLLNRSTVIPLGVDIFSEDASLHYRVLYNPASLTNASWTNFDTTHSGVQYDISATAVSGGVRVGAGYVAQARNQPGASSIAIQSELALTLDSLGTTGDVLTVACIRVGTVDTDAGVTITWKELY